MRSSLRNIIAIVEDIFDCDIMEDNRTRKIVDARMCYGYLARKLITDHNNHPIVTYAEIGDAIGKNHATILHYTREFDNIMKYDKELRDKFVFALEKCKGILETNDFLPKDAIDMHWHDLSFEEQKKISLMVEDMISIKQVQSHG